MKKYRSFAIRCLVFLSLLSVGLSVPVSDALKGMEDAFVQISETVGPAVVTIGVVQILNRGYGQGPRGEYYSFEDFLYDYFKNAPGGRQEFKQKGLGSGFIINQEGYILTNDHVVGDADEIEVTLPDGRTFKAAFIGSDPRNDIALIKINGDNLPYVKLGDSEQVKPGQWSIALGNPFGNIVNNPKPTVTAGIVSAIHRTLHVYEEGRMYGDLIQTDAAINQGNSGGPLVNLAGEVIGINTLIFSPSGGNVGIGFAIPINRGKMILNDLISGKEIKHGWLGLWLQDMDRDMLKQFGMAEDKSGALVFKVEEGSPAEKSGFLSGDIIVEIQGEPCRDSNDVTRIISGTKPGQTIECKIFRKKQIQTIKAAIGERKEPESSRRKSPVAAQDQKVFEWRGLRVENITDDIAEKLNLPSREGVVVSGVAFGSSAHRAKIRPGDVIYSIAQEPVDTVEDFYSVAKKYSKGDVLIQTSKGYMVLFEK